MLPHQSRCLVASAQPMTGAAKESDDKNQKMSLAERGFDPRTSGLWAQHASTAPLCYTLLQDQTQTLTIPYSTLSPIQPPPPPAPPLSHITTYSHTQALDSLPVLVGGGKDATAIDAIGCRGAKKVVGDVEGDRGGRR